jgi:hypothetical protein
MVAETASIVEGGHANNTNRLIIELNWIEIIAYYVKFIAP